MQPKILKLAIWQIVLGSLALAVFFCASAQADTHFGLNSAIKKTIRTFRPTIMEKLEPVLPVISLSADKTIVPQSGATTITCSVFNKPSYAFEYIWTASGGNLLTTSKNYQRLWVAPAQPGNYMITCLVKDKWSQTSSSINILVQGTQYSGITGWPIISAKKRSML
jgi:hypothetical protein